MVPPKMADKCGSDLNYGPMWHYTHMCVALHTHSFIQKHTYTCGNECTFEYTHMSGDFELISCLGVVAARCVRVCV